MRAVTATKARRIALVILLAMLLVTATTAGNVWHHHATATAESTCTICHLGHQTAQQPVLMQSAPSLWAAASEAPPFEPFLTDGPVIPQLATRAPPSL